MIWMKDIEYGQTEFPITRSARFHGLWPRVSTLMGSQETEWSVSFGGNQMPYEDGQLSLIGYLGMEPMQKRIKTRFFGKPYILFSDFIGICSYLYETGAILGSAKRDK